MSAAAARSSLAGELRKLTKGLTYMSESDYPVEPFSVKGDGRKSLKASDLSKKPAKQIDFDSFFGSAMADEEWHGPEEKEAARRFRELVDALTLNLSDIKVYKAGKAGGAEFDVYVVGRTPDGDFAGVTTKVVET